MTRLTKALAEICGKHLFEEKWLLARSLRVGHQWLDTVARGGSSILNVHVKTLNSIALELAAVEMVARGVTLFPGRAGVFFVDRILREELSDRLEYLKAARPSARLAEIVLAGINAMRMVDMSPADVDKETFEVSLKGEDLAIIMEAYGRLLEAEKMIDYADVLKLAIARLSEGAGAPGDNILILQPEDLEATGLERRFLERLPAERRRILPVEQLPGPSDSPGEVKTDIELLRWVLHPSGGPEASRDGSVTITRAIGVVNEVRSILRRCAVGRIPLDEVEILHTDSGTYVPLIYETLLAMDQGGNGEGVGLPVTFREGIPCRYSRPGQALSAWLKWSADGYPQHQLVRMIREGLLELPGSEEEHAGFERLAALLRGVGIGFGRDRYLPKISELMDEVRSRRKIVSESVADDAEMIVVRLESIDRDLRDLGLLKDLIKGLLDIARDPDEETRQAGMVSMAKEFLERAARCVNRLDRFARRRLVEELDDMRYWLAREERETGIDIREWLETLPSAVTVLGSGPRPGCLYVDSISSGGHSGRPNTFIVGLDDSRFPGAGLQDPLLLDNERGRISSEIPTAAKRLERRMEDFVRLLARLRGRVSLSFPCRNLVEDRDMFPSPVLLSIYRILTGDVEGDQQDFFEWLPTPASFAPANPDGSLDGVEWWMWRMTSDEAVEDPVALVESSFPHLAGGRMAEEVRAGTKFTEYDGHVPLAGEELDPTAESAPVMSSSRLQTIGECPRRFFFQYGLGLSLPEDLAIDLRQWLDPLARGSMLHELFERFMRDLVREERAPSRSIDGKRLELLLRDKVAEYRERFPPPSDTVFGAEYARIMRTAEMFLSEEEIYYATSDCLPLYLEASLGLPADGHGTPLDTEEPVDIELPGGRSIHARGRIDRIDRMVEKARHEYVIWDYKTGSAWGFDKADPFRQGRKVQPYLYVEMATRRLRDSVSPKARIASFGFFFPGDRAAGERIVWKPDELSEGGGVIERLCYTVANGAFAATNESGDCRYCDFISICGDVESVAARSGRKMEEAANTMLEPFRSLRGIETV